MMPASALASRKSTESQSLLSTAKTGDDAAGHTLWLKEDGTEEPVGELSLEGVSRPEKKWPMATDLCFFLSHTGRDGVKETIARPTYWFLSEVLRVRAMLDDESLLAGDKTKEVLMASAYECTHALVILSPSYRSRKYCVRELNTFMGRLRRGDGIRVLPALWTIQNVDGYHADVDNLIWIQRPGQSDAAVEYLLHALWPALVEEVGASKITPEALRAHLQNYVDSHRIGPRAIPACLDCNSVWRSSADEQSYRTVV